MLEGELHRRPEALGFGMEGGAAGAREAVVAPAPIVEIRVRSPRRLLDEALIFEPADGGVEGAGAKAHGALGLLLDGLSDEVAVPVARREGEEDLVGGGREGARGRGV